MTRGRKKLPQEVLDLRGTARKDRLRPSSTIGTGVAEVTCWTFPGYDTLTDRAKGIFRRNVRAAIALKILEQQDLVAMVAYAREYDLYLTLCEDVRLHGSKYYVEDKLGQMHWFANPSVAAANAALRNLNSIGSNFGFSPVDRQKIKLQQEDPREKIKRIMVEFNDEGPDNQ